MSEDNLFYSPLPFDNLEYKKQYTADQRCEMLKVQGYTGPEIVQIMKQEEYRRRSTCIALLQQGYRVIWDRVAQINGIYVSLNWD